MPVTETFAQRSPYVLHRQNGALRPAPRRRRDHDARALAAARAGTTQKTSTGKPMTRIGTLQGTYLGVYPAKVCEYWTEKPEKTNCKFCSVGLNLGVDDADDKSVERGDGGDPGGARASPASPTSTSTPATTRATPTSTSSSPTSAASRRRSASWSACRRRPTPTSSATTRCARWASTASRSASRSSTRACSRRSARASTGSTASSATSTRSSTARTLGEEGAEERAVGHERRDHRRPRAAGVVDRGDRLDHVGGRHPDGLRLPAAGRDRLRRHAGRRRPRPLIPVFRRLYEACMEKGLPDRRAPRTST